MKIKLYSYFRSSASYRIRIALALKNLTYETIPISLIKDGGEQHSDKYVSLNPMHQVPSVDIDGLLLTQSLPIIEYLDELTPDSSVRLLPVNPIDRVWSRQIAEIINSGIQPLQNLSTLKSINGDPQAWARSAMEKGFTAIEAILQQSADKYCVGNNVSIADLCLVPQVYNANRFKVDLTPYPIISRVNSELCLLEAVQAAHPSKQVDSPPEDPSA